MERRRARQLTPRVLAEPRAAAFEPWKVLEVDRDATALPQCGAVELEPARGAALRQAAAGDEDVGVAARRGELDPFDPVAAADREQAPGAAVANDVGDAGIAGALRERLPSSASGSPS